MIKDEAGHNSFQISHIKPYAQASSSAIEMVNPSRLQPKIFCNTVQECPIRALGLLVPFILGIILGSQESKRGGNR